jgi:hypothetical protein
MIAKANNRNNICEYLLKKSNETKKKNNPKITIYDEATNDDDDEEDEEDDLSSKTDSTDNKKSENDTKTEDEEDEFEFYNKLITTFQNQINAKNKDTTIMNENYEEYFKKIRNSFNISDEFYLESINSCINQILKFGINLSVDKQMILKILNNKNDIKFFNTNIKSYSNYLESNKDSILIRYFGLYTIFLEEKKIYIIIQNNVFNKNNFKYKFNFKGKIKIHKLINI